MPVERETPAPPQIDVPFEAHIDLLRFFLAHRGGIVGRIEGVLSAQRKPAEYRQNRDLLWRDFESCFFATAGLTQEQARLRGQLQDAHWAQGFKPRWSPGMSNDLIDPAELMRRGFHLWSSTRWPGGSARQRYAETLFNVYALRQLALLAMRVWDADAAKAGDRLAQVQAALDALWAGSPGDQPVLVRDARSLIPVALSPATEDLAPYFEVAERIATSFSADDRVEILKAVVRMAGGHLRSYLHYYVTQKGATLDEPVFVVRTRKSEALDFSLLIHGLVPLVAAYERAIESGDGRRRRELADAICQGISPDPELFVNRVELLGPYSMVEYLFTAEDRDGHAVYTALGSRHVELLEEYAARIARVREPLYEDCQHFRPQRGEYSPYGALYGVASNLLEHMALKILDRDADTRFGLEDVFTAGGADKVAWASGWRRLPHVSREVAMLYAYPEAFAEQIFARLEGALRRGAEAAAGGAPQTGRLFVVAEGEADASLAQLPALPLRFIVSSDRELVAGQRAHAADEAQLLRDRQEGHFLLSYATANGWLAISKDVLTEVLAAGHDAKIAALPRATAARLSLLGRDRVVLAAP